MPVALVLDDDPVILRIAEVALGDEGFEVHTAATAVDAMAYVRRLDLDLLIVDLTLPGLDGFTFVSGIRALQLASNARVVIISGRDDERALNRARELSIADFLVKPVDVVDFVNLARTTTG